MKISIKNKILFYVFISIFFIIIIYGLIIYIGVKKNIEVDIENRLTMSGKLIKEQINPEEILILKLQGKIHERYLKKLGQLKEILDVNDIFIIDANKKVIFSLFAKKEKFFLDIDKFEISNAFKGKQTSSPFYIGTGGKYFKTGYIPINENWVAGIEINVLYEKYLKQYARLFFIVSVIALLFGFLISFLISSGISKSIIKLKEKAEKISKREFDENIKINAVEEEIVILSETIDKMKREIKEYIENKEKMATIGEFSAGIAHEMRNSLNILSGYAELIIEKTQDEKITNYAVEIKKNVWKFNNFLNNFLTYTKDFTPEFIKADIKNILIKVINEFFKGEENIIKIEYDDNEKFIKDVDEYLLKKAFYNIILNSYHAVSRNKDKKILIKLLNEKDGRIKIIIRDNGIGIDEKIKDKIFQPFVTAKKEGVGLGLAITYRIIKEIHKGEIFVDSQKNIGTEFTIVL